MRNITRIHLPVDPAANLGEGESRDGLGLWYAQVPEPEASAPLCLYQNSHLRSQLYENAAYVAHRSMLPDKLRGPKSLRGGAHVVQVKAPEAITGRPGDVAVSSVRTDDYCSGIFSNRNPVIRFVRSGKVPFRRIFFVPFPQL